MPVVLISSVCVKKQRWEGRRILLTHDDNEKKVVAIYYEEEVKMQHVKKKGMRITFVVVQCNGKSLEYCPCVTAFSPDFKEFEPFVFYLKSMKGFDKFFLAARMNRKKLLNSIFSLSKTTVYINGTEVDVKAAKAAVKARKAAKAAKAAKVAKAPNEAAADDFGTDTESESSGDDNSSMTKKRKIATI